MINLEDQYFTVLKDIIRSYIPDSKVILYGSRTKNKCKIYSDIDIAVIGKNKLDEKLKRDMVEAFDESKLPYRVDIVDWFDLDDDFKKIILGNGSVIQ